MIPPKRSMEREQFMFGVGEEGTASEKWDLGVEKRLDGTKVGIGVEDDFAIVSRVLITNLRYCSGFIPEKISSDKLPSVNARFITG